MRIAAVVLALAFAADWQPAPALVLDGDAAIITVLVRPERAAAFDQLVSRLKSSLQGSANPVRKAQAAGWQVLKSPDLVQGSVSYIMRIDPVVRGQEYDIARLIGEANPADVAAVNQSLRDAQIARSVLTMQRVNVDGLGLAASAPAGKGPAASLAPVLSFQDADAAVITVLVRPEQIADYEATLTMLGKAMQSSAVPIRKRQASGWKVYKSTQLLGGNVAYVMLIDPVEARAEYDPIRLIQEVYPSEVPKLFERYRAAFAGQAVIRLGTRVEMRQ